MADARPLRDDHDLQWPPSAADLDSVVAVSLDDDGVRRLASSLMVQAAPRRPRRRRWLVPAALAASCVMAVGGAAWWVRPEPGAEEPPITAVEAVRTVETRRPQSAAGEGLERVSQAEPRVIDAPVQPGPVVEVGRVESAGRTDALPVAAPAAPADTIDAPTELTASPTEVTLPVAPRDRVEIAASVPSDALGGAVPVELAAVPSRRALPASEAEAGAVPPDARRANEEPAIRALLEQYGNAYSRLDARAARAVWPGVDVEALARAFDALESQDIDFERCDVQVDGTAARAACRGTSTWVPRVGERRARRDTREWTFRLVRAPDAQWRIQSASMR